MHNLELAHKWEALGYKPPFKCVGIYSMPSPSLGESNPQAFSHQLSQMPKGFSCGYCSVCGIGLVHNFLIVDGAGHQFSVGSDCVKKIGDVALMTSIEKTRLKFNREKAQAKRDAERARKQAAFEAQLDQERAANGGLTDAEVIAKKQRDEAMAIRVANQISNEWIVSALKGCWMTDTLNELASGEKLPSDLSPGALNMLAKEYGKLAGRTNSAAYERKRDEFFQRIDSMVAA